LIKSITRFSHLIPSNQVGSSNLFFDYFMSISRLFFIDHRSFLPVFVRPDRASNVYVVLFFIDFRIFS